MPQASARSAPPGLAITEEDSVRRKGNRKSHLPAAVYGHYIYRTHRRVHDGGGSFCIQLIWRAPIQILLTGIVAQRVYDRLILSIDGVNYVGNNVCQQAHKYGKENP